MKKLFVLGDSISIQYGPDLKSFVSDYYDYNRKGGLAGALKDLNIPIGANGGNSNLVLEYLQKQNSNDKMDYDILLLNCGLHDIKTDKDTGEKQVNEHDYSQNLTAICSLVKEKGIRLIWVSTTPVDDETHKQKMDLFYRYNRDVLQYNAIADEIMNQYGNATIDLYTFVEKLGKDVYFDHVHFKKKIRTLQAAYLAGCLYGML